ncbi:amidohydrolase family protein [Pseudoduganella sp. FT25W]|uniref:Amidohydrolase family protein n=1 Tax=Duganella alba TaxID=2666081 RepID=A0A6L5QML6_9BURK|nr:amidohydrolase family protein [Duganella alba]MRX10492.1 amidohydrolase family protein [Duganella alba]MRX18112.1 amidohydrolase family protein [Duganella alba]
MRWTAISAILASLLATPFAGAADGYTMRDFDKVAKIDAHLHLHGENQDAWLALARKDNFRALTINVDYPDFPSLAQQRRVAIAAARQHPRQIAWAATFSTEGFEKPDWSAATLKDLDGAVANGAVGVKVWKNLGMSLRDSQGRLVMVDDPRFDTLFDGLAQRGVMVLGHQGEPHNCWLPLAQMTVENDREYFAAHPAYHMYKHPEMPSYEQQMAARDHLLARHPKLRFTGVHLASLEYDVDRLGRFLDTHPGVNVDVAARIGQLQYQSQRDREKMRAFFIKYQDRLMYGTDLAQSTEQDDAGFVKDMDTVWRRDWRYFVTADSFAVPELDKQVRGLSLPRAVVDKLYRINAEKAYPQAWH